jgi:hypothetical protein
MIRGGILASRAGPFALAVLASQLLVRPFGAQTRFTYSKGQSVSPAYEGWMPNEDGSFTLYFGYMNTNWLEEFDIPTGADNNIEPGGPRPRAADALLSTPEPVSVHDSRAEGFRR